MKKIICLLLLFISIDSFAVYDDRDSALAACEGSKPADTGGEVPYPPDPAYIEGARCDCFTASQAGISLPALQGACACAYNDGYSNWTRCGFTYFHLIGCPVDAPPNESGECTCPNGGNYDESLERCVRICDNGQEAAENGVECPEDCLGNQYYSNILGTGQCNAACSDGSPAPNGNTSECPLDCPDGQEVVTVGGAETCANPCPEGSSRQADGSCSPPPKKCPDGMKPVNWSDGSVNCIPDGSSTSTTGSSTTGGTTTTTTTGGSTGATTTTSGGGTTTTTPDVRLVVASIFKK